MVSAFWVPAYVVGVMSVDFLYRFVEIDSNAKSGECDRFSTSGHRLQPEATDRWSEVSACYDVDGGFVCAVPAVSWPRAKRSHQAA